MASPFSRTLRSLEADGHRRSLLGLVPAILLLAAWAGWFLLAKVVLYEVTDVARLSTEREAHPIATPVGGRVSAVRAVLGQRVKAGEILVELEGEEQLARLDEERGRQAALAGQIGALRRQIAAGGEGLSEQRRGSGSALAETRARLAETEAAALSAEQEAARQERLLAEGLVSPAEAERARSTAEQRRAAVESQRRALDRLGWSERTGASDRQGDLEELERELALLEGQAATATATVRRLERDLSLRTIRSPVAGRIGQLAPVPVGSVIGPGASLGMVVPEGGLMVIAEFLPAEALGRIRPDQPASVRLQGFPSIQYGDLAATVARVAAEPRGGRIRVELAAHPVRGSRLPLQHGLPATVEVEVERVTPAVLVLRTVGKIFERPAFGAAASAGS
ncbi:MAG TPA: HlyD family efflux transporter periplasmic adaptor subunit [Thermoanaerobaculia bacterium]|jgi:membrane fusion protein (multidrug efflux system)|nr:HlyD family efflux transporter periplasmic adaptor subunit [Thermoanaerobaculia bacterium]